MRVTSAYSHFIWDRQDKSRFEKFLDKFEICRFECFGDATLLSQLVVYLTVRKVSGNAAFGRRYWSLNKITNLLCPLVWLGNGFYTGLMKLYCGKHAGFALTAHFYNIDKHCIYFQIATKCAIHKCAWYSVNPSLKTIIKVLYFLRSWVTILFLDGIFPGFQEDTLSCLHVSLHMARCAPPRPDFSRPAAKVCESQSKPCRSASKLGLFKTGHHHGRGTEQLHWSLGGSTL